MSLNLEKGEKVDLSKGKSDLTVLGFGLGWDMKPGQTVDLDASAICLGANGKRVDPDLKKSVCYFGNLTGVAGITHSGDNLTGAGDGDDEVIKLTLANMNPATEKVALFLNIYNASSKGQRFGQVKNATVRAFNAVTNEEYFKYDVSEDGGANTGMIMGYAYKHNGEWKFEAASEFTNGSINEIIDQKGW